MASQDNAPSFDDMSPINSSNDNDDEDVYKLDPGEKVVAQIRHIERNVGRFDNDLLHLTFNTGEFETIWSNNTIRKALDQIEAKAGDWIGIAKDEEPYTYTVENDETGESEEKEAYGYEVRQLGDD